MNVIRIRAFVLAAAIAVFLLALSACSGGGEDKSGSPPKEVKLVGYLLGDAPKGFPDVLDALNAKLNKDIHATLEINHIGWSDFVSKYPQVLASGEDVDFVFAADWSFYVSEATKGAFYPLDPAMLERFMPRHMAKLPKKALDATKVNGIPYLIPTSTPDRKVSVALLRKDILDEAGLPAPTRMSQLEPYFEIIKRHYPNMIPLNLDSRFDLPSPFMYLLNEKVAYPGAPFDSGDPNAEGVSADNEDPSGKIVTMVEEPYLNAQKYAARIVKDWYDKGYINKNPYANKTRSKNNFCEGKSGVAFGNSIDIAPVVTACNEKGIDVVILPQLSPSGHADRASPLNNGVAVAANSKHPERVLQALDLIMEDESYVNLVYFGIEGKHYVVTPDGKIGLPPGLKAADNAYTPDVSGFWFVNKDYFKPIATWTDAYIDHYNKVQDYLVDTTYLGFSFNNDNVKSQVANIKNVSSQYAEPIFIGAVKDVDAAFDTLISKLKAAGIDEVKAEVQKQAAEFLRDTKR